MLEHDRSQNTPSRVGEVTNRQQGDHGLDPAAGGLPAYLTRFVGRAQELRELDRLLARHRLVTICGAGGLGKTRLAVEVAQRCRRRFPDGVLWVSLVGVGDAAAADRTIGSAVLPDRSAGVDPIASASAAIGRRQMLIIVDNCEQVAAACAASLTRLLDQCPALTVVATSRIAVQGRAEEVYSVPPLHLPADVSGGGDAVSLFVDRATLGAPGWRVTAGVDPVVVEICRRLEGLPLAIELAASWVRVLSPQDLLSEISRGIDALSDAGHLVADRHRTLQAVLDTTWTWLGDADRDVLARLSVFVDGFTRAAAEAVAGATLGVLATLSERALIRRLPDASGVTRFHVHELVRVFAEQRLRTQHRWRVTEHRHYSFFVDLVGSAQAAWDSEDEPAALALIADDQGNVEAAVTRAVERGAATEALRLAGGLFAYWIYTAPLESRREILDRALSLPPDEAEDPGVRARALNVAAYAWFYGDPERAHELFSRAVELYRIAGDRPGEAWTLRGLGYVHLLANDFETSERLNRESLRICREAGDRAGIAWSLYDGAESAVAHRDLDRARPLLNRARAEFAELGIDFATYRTLILLGDVQRLLHAWIPAVDLYRQALVLQQRRGFTTRGAEIMDGLAALAVEVGRDDLTARLHGASATWREALGTARLGYNEADFEAAHASAQRRLPSADWLHLFEDGQRLTFADAQIDTEKIIHELLGWCQAAPVAQLTRREVEVLRLIAEGLSNPDIAGRLVLSPRTVHAHVRSIFDKLNVSTRTAAALKARELAIEPPPS